MRFYQIGRNRKAVNVICDRKAINVLGDPDQVGVNAPRAEAHRNPDRRTAGGSTQWAIRTEEIVFARSVS